MALDDIAKVGHLVAILKLVTDSDAVCEANPSNISSVQVSCAEIRTSNSEGIGSFVLASSDHSVLASRLSRQQQKLTFCGTRIAV